MAKIAAAWSKFLCDRANRGAGSRRRFLKTLVGGSAVAAGALALPKSFSRVLAGGGSDLDVLNYALTLEHLENAYYRDGLKIFGPGDFYNFNGGPFGVHDAFLLIMDHEREHVETLTDVIKSLGGTPVPECTYDFGSAYQDVSDFVALAEVFENTGVSAYDGAIHLISNPDLITAGATIATVEARHASFLNLINNDTPFPDAFDTPKSMEEIMEMIAPFIVSC